MRYLVTSNINRLPKTSIAMVDGTVPGWEQTIGNLHYDHHRSGEAKIQIDGMFAIPEPLKAKTTIVTTQLNADACTAAAYLQIHHLISANNLRKLRAIAYKCNNLSVPDELSDLRKFAALAVATLKSE